MAQEKEREKSGSEVWMGRGGGAKGWTCKELDIEQKAENQW